MATMVYQIFANQPQGGRPRGRPKSRWWDSVYGDIRNCKIRNWEQRSKNREDWMRSIKEVKAPHRAVEPTKKKMILLSITILLLIGSCPLNAIDFKNKG
jgi:hypothetical protein